MVFYLICNKTQTAFCCQHLNLLTLNNYAFFCKVYANDKANARSNDISGETWRSLKCALMPNNWQQNTDYNAVQLSCNKCQNKVIFKWKLISGQEPVVTFAGKAEEGQGGKCRRFKSLLISKQTLCSSAIFVLPHRLPPPTTWVSHETPGRKWETWIWVSGQMKPFWAGMWS